MSCSKCLLTLKGMLCTCCRPVGHGRKNRNKKPKAAEGAAPASVGEATPDEWTSVNKGKQAPGSKPGDNCLEQVACLQHAAGQVSVTLQPWPSHVVQAPPAAGVGLITLQSLACPRAHSSFVLPRGLRQQHI